MLLHPITVNKWVRMTMLSCILLCACLASETAAQTFNLTVAATNQIKIYGTPFTFVTANTPVPSPDYTITGDALQPGDSVDSITLTSAGSPAAAPVTGSPYSIIPSSAIMTVTSGNNYNITYVNGTMSVMPTTTTLTHSEYRFPILLPESQKPTIWTNVVPNALADYFTYVPYSQADAVKLGFPDSCGVSEDCYSISARKFQQQLALPSVFGGGNGLINPGNLNTPFGAITNVYGYGSGGTNWTLPYYDTTKTNMSTGLPVVAGTPVTGNAPAAFAGTGIWHFPAPTIKAIKGRPVRVQWLNELPNEKPTGFDPTVCDGSPVDCFPYNRIVTHVHGAHVGPESDGLTHAWFTPGFLEKGLFWESNRQHGPEGTYYYPMDQEAGTIWYHDHAVGTTHNNTNMGMAGFFTITDPNETSLKNSGKIPTGAQELGFALQDRVFYNNGQMAMPDAPILDANNPLIGTCTYTYASNGDIVPDIPGNCSPLFMKNPLDGHLVPYVNDGNNVPLLATSATLEFFGNMPVVNGVTYGKYNVDKGVYRLRFIGGTDSRAWILRLRIADSTPATYLPFWVIGTEQGLLNNPVRKEHLLIMPGERYDVLVDFNTAEAVQSDGVTSAGAVNLANQRVIVENWAGDGPYGGEVVLPANDPLAMDFRSADIPEVMVFDVSGNPAALTIAPPSPALALRPGTTIQQLASTTVRTVSLVEIVDNYGRVMPTIDGRGFMGNPVTELPRLGDIEQWDIINTTVDAHPMHLHQVAFQIIEREDFAQDCTIGETPLAPQCVTPAGIAPGPYTPASVIKFAAPGTITPADSSEAGWKDTVMCPPGKVTRVRAKFDIPGTYVWHCHILSHEEHDMMRPLVVTSPATNVTMTSSGISQSTAATMSSVDLAAQAFTRDINNQIVTGNGFEYEFVTYQADGTTVLAEQPVRVESKFTSSTGDGFSMVRTASWIPPATPGNYVITISAKAMGPADISNPVKKTSITYTVENITVNIGNTNSTYNGTPQPVTISTTPHNLPVVVTYNGSTTPPTNAGIYNVIATVNDSQGGNFGSAKATLVINKAPLTVTASAASKIYGAPDPVFAYSVTGFQNNESSAIVTGALSRVAGENSGIYAITSGTLYAGINYSITLNSANLIITKALLTITAQNNTKTYGSYSPVLSYSATGFQFVDTTAIITGSLSRTAGENTGVYTITKGSLSAGNNYTISFTGATFTITPAVLNITATTKSKTYGMADPALTYSVSGLQLADTTRIITGTLSRAAGENIGIYNITKNTLAAGSNYTISFTTAFLSITKATLDVTPAVLSKTYGASDPALTYAVNGFRFTDNSNIISGALSRVTGENVGNYNITLGSLNAGSNYSINLVPASLTITPAILNITASVTSKIYGTPDPILNYVPSGFKFADTSGIITGTLSRTTGENVGSYSITLGTVSAGNNYTINFVAATLTVTPATLNITADATSKTYGTPDPLLTYNASGFKPGDTAASIISGSLTRTPGENSGIYNISKGSLSAGSNYSINFTGAYIIITQATLNITAVATSKIYGSPDPALTYTASGFQFNDTASGIISGILTRTTGETVAGGPYSISQGTLTAGSNYTISFISASFTITPAILAITADAVSKSYGIPDPPLSYTTSGFQLGDTGVIISGALARISGESVAGGPYAITQGTVTAGSNYAVMFTGSTLTINPAVLSISADGVSKIYGSADPALTYTATGFRFNDNTGIITGTLSRTAGETVVGGPYPILQGSLSAGSNYTINFTGSSLTITPAVLTVIATPNSKTYGATDPALNYTATGFKFSDNSTGSISGVLSRTVGESVTGGPYNITQGTITSVSSNYTVSFTGASLVINPAVLNITAASRSKEYGGNILFNGTEFTANGLVNGETIGTVTIVSSGSIPTASVIGSPYAIIPGNAGGGTFTPSNYSINYINGSLTVNKAATNITWATPAALTYGTALSSAQLNAAANVPGSFSYTPNTGVKPTSSQTLSVIFIPADPINYLGSKASVYLAVTSSPVPMATIGTNTTANYATIPDAITIATDGQIIKLMAGTFTGPVLIEPVTQKTVTLIGGFDATYNLNSAGTTTISNSLTIKSGTIVVDNITIR